MKIRLLGTGTPTPSLTRMSSGYMVTLGADVLLFDHGPGAHHRMLEAGVNAVDVTHMFFSHLHYDHCLDYARLVLTRWDQGAGRIPELKVVGPKFTRRMSELLFAPEGVFGPDLTARTSYPGSLAVYERRGGVMPRAWPKPEIVEIKSGKCFETDNWKVTARNVIHQQPYLECFAYRLDSPAGSFVYTGDTGPCKGIERLAEGCDVLVHMCHYIDRKSTRLNSSHVSESRMPSSA